MKHHFIVTTRVRRIYTHARARVGVSLQRAILQTGAMSSKASAALRRGSVRLRSSLGSGHTSLNLLISEYSHVRQKYKDLVAAESSAFQTVQRWSHNEESPAVQDVLHQVSELHLMWVEAERDFIVALKEYKRVFEQILEMEKRLDQARKQLATCEEKERKLQKELVKGPKEPALIQEKLRQATDTKSLAEAEVTGQFHEMEAIKLMSLRAGLLDMSNAWSTLGKKCCILAESQKELAQLVPDVNTRTQDLPTYTGSRESTRVLQTTKSQLDHMDPPSYGPGLASCPPSGTRPSSASKQPPRRTSRRLSEPLTMPQLQALQKIDQDYDSFDSFDSD